MGRTLTALNTINFLYDATLALLYPQACAVCGASVESRFDGVACAPCWQETELFDSGETLCWKCGALSLAQIAPEKRAEVSCRRCDDAAFTAARACGPYEGALRASIIALKRDPFIARRLSWLLRDICARPPLDQTTLIVPVPLHCERERQRGFNQAALLAREISKFTAWPVDDQSLARVTHTGLHRAGMDAQARRDSVEHAFTVTNARMIEGERVLLVDDVFTSGATASACAAALQAAGAHAVFVVTVARPRI